MHYVGEIRNRSLRLDDENYAWLQGLPGRSLNDGVERLRLTGGVVPTDVMQCNAEVAEILELVRSLPEAIETALALALEPLLGGAGAVSGPLDRDSETDRRPKNCFCKHCGSRFAGPKFSTICSECKGSGHTLTPSECPKCNEASAI